MIAPNFVLRCDRWRRAGLRPGTAAQAFHQALRRRYEQECRPRCPRCWAQSFEWVGSAMPHPVRKPWRKRPPPAAIPSWTPHTGLARRPPRICARATFLDFEEFFGVVAEHLSFVLRAELQLPDQLNAPTFQRGQRRRIGP